jgi:hypothetical protein
MDNEATLLSWKLGKPCGGLAELVKLQDVRLFLVGGTRSWGSTGSLTSV